MWDEPKGVIAIIYASDFKNENKLEQEAAKANPANTIVVRSFTDLIRQYTSIIDKTRVRLYTDTKGRTELEKACADLPVRMKKELFSAITLLEQQTVNNTSKAVTEYMDTWKAVSASQNKDIQREIDAELNNPDYTKFSIKVDGSDKKLEQSNVLYKDALNKILQFISTLTKEEKLNIGITWFHDNGEGDPVLWLETPTEAKENLFDDGKWDKWHMDDPLNRILENWDGDYAVLCIVKALSDVSTGGPLSSAIKFLLMKYKACAGELAEAVAGTTTVDWDYRGNWHYKTAPKEVYALMATKNSRSGSAPVFVYWDLNGIDGYFEAAESLTDIDNEYSFYETVSDAEVAANDAYNQSEIAGWRGPINIVKITNFNDAYYRPHKNVPKYSIVKTV